MAQRLGMESGEIGELHRDEGGTNLVRTPVFTANSICIISIKGRYGSIETKLTSLFIIVSDLKKVPRLLNATPEK